MVRKQSKAAWTLRPSTAVVVVGLIATIGMSDRAAALDAAKVFAITEWGNCGDSNDTRSGWDDYCLNWWIGMLVNGWGGEMGAFESAVTIEKFDAATDNSSPFGIDTAEASMVCTHGRLATGSDAGWYGLMHHRVDGECGANYNQLNLGQATGGDLRYWHMSSCNSINWVDRWKWSVAAAGGVHTITGFHGTMWINSWYSGDYTNFANDAFIMGIGYAWLKDMKRPGVWPFNGAQCPMAIGYSNNGYLAFHRAYAESYKHPTPESPAGTNTRATYILYWAGCAPNGSTPPIPN